MNTNQENLAGIFFELARIAFNRQDLGNKKLKKFSEFNILIIIIQLILLLILFILININAGDCVGSYFRKFENVYLSFYLVYVVVDIISFSYLNSNFNLSNHFSENIYYFTYSIDFHCCMLFIMAIYSFFCCCMPR